MVTKVNLLMTNFQSSQMWKSLTPVNWLNGQWIILGKTESLLGRSLQRHGMLPPKLELVTALLCVDQTCSVLILVELVSFMFAFKLSTLVIF